jgi:hypothetical protein
MPDQTPEEPSTGDLNSGVESITDARFTTAESAVRRSARRLLLALILVFLAISITACLVISGTGGVGGGVGVTSEQITETYGAEQFHIQLTAQARESQQRSIGSP